MSHHAITIVSIFGITTVISITMLRVHTSDRFILYPSICCLAFIIIISVFVTCYRSNSAMTCYRHLKNDCLTVVFIRWSNLRLQKHGVGRLNNIADYKIIYSDNLITSIQTLAISYRSTMLLQYYITTAQKRIIKASFLLPAHGGKHKTNRKSTS